MFSRNFDSVILTNSLQRQTFLSLLLPRGSNGCGKRRKEMGSMPNAMGKEKYVLYLSGSRDPMILSGKAE